MGSDAKKRLELRQVRASKYTTTCQPSGAMRRAISCSTSVRRDVDQALHEVEAHAAHAGVMQLAQVALSVTSRETVATPRARPAELRSASDQRAIVGAMTGALHDHVALEAQEIAQRQELFLGRIAWACTCARGA